MLGPNDDVVVPENVVHAGMTPAPIKGKKFFAEDEEKNGAGEDVGIVLPENTDRAGMTPAPVLGRKHFQDDDSDEE